MKNTKSAWKTCWNGKKWWLTGNLLDFSYHQSYYKIIGIGLSRQAKAIIPQQINFTQILEEEDDGATMFFIAEKQQKLF